MDQAFEEKKRKILDQLSAPDDAYADLSPKGSVDEAIRHLISDTNRVNGLVTTSSCSGRVSVFLEGRRKDGLSVTHNADGDEATTTAGPGGKGGGSWLYVSHEAVGMPAEHEDTYFHSLFGLASRSSDQPIPDGDALRYARFKFEPMILHILARSLQDAQKVLSAALSAGFRESGAVSIVPTRAKETMPTVAVRSSGLMFDAPVGLCAPSGLVMSIVTEAYLRHLVSIANDRFRVNSERTERFKSALLDQFSLCSLKELGGREKVEDAEARKTRKRAEGLKVQEESRFQKSEPMPAVDISEIGNIFRETH
ncbi:methyltransferase TYW3-domain-containing protein [Lineolata rhizophorae]|uniref:tRNA(Phe) 7-[(3-amino-3-carboxypropyl)-4-demethylwyosine(37)-N(4)]-methyltransferase n=1 Tax=Lineolata rhizophorae TaxID=578093 RepID=A0A6A6NTB4_9PEZI|nr:methyltransferase TYW3-domain-containing protein [Lineolata rhizophorae]